MARGSLNEASVPRILHLACFIVFLIVTGFASSSAAHSGPRKEQSSLRARAIQQAPNALSSLEAPSAIDNLYLADVVILSAIDGSLTAVDRASGKTQWILDGSSISLPPLVSSHYGKRRSSLARILSAPLDQADEIGEIDVDDEEARKPIDGLPPQTRHLLNHAGMYVVEPGSSGRLYLLTGQGERGEADNDWGNSNGGGHQHHDSKKGRLQRLPLTLPQLVELSPFSFPGDRGRVFTGTKRTRLLRIDVMTGQLDTAWEADGSELMDFPGDEQQHQGQDGRGHRWTYLARTDYTLSIASPRRPHLSQTLQYSTYAPQSSDADVAARWVDSHQRSNRKGVVILPTGWNSDGRGTAKVTAYNETTQGKRQSWTANTNSQVVDVFDVLVPDPRQQHPTHPHPIVVPHPPFARPDGSGISEEDDDDDEKMREETLLTLSPETGSLYAMSSERFPGVVREIKPAIAGLDAGQRAERGLVPGSAGSHNPMQCRTFGCWMGRYRVEDGDGEQDLALGRYGLPPSRGRRTPLEISDTAANPEHEAQREQEAAQPVTTREPIFSKRAVLTQLLIIAVVAVMTLLARRTVAEVNRRRHDRNYASIRDMGLQWESTPQEAEGKRIEALAGESKAQAEGSVPPPVDESKAIASTPAVVTESERAAQADEAAASLLAEESGAKAEGTTADSTATVKKKRRKRGKRSGAAVRARQEGSAAGGDDESGGSEGEGAPTQDSARARTSNGGTRPTSMAKNPSSSSSTLSNGWIQIGPGSSSAQDQLVALANSKPSGDAAASTTPALQLSDEVLGYGSSGTVVFKGRFQNRLVAVKRLLVDFVHLASQEISLLESADDHSNVIRYFYKEQVGNFLFIALELCPASLGDLVEKPEEWQDLAVRLEPKRAIQQVASGLRHLHALSIVHRDIKPQNILVAYANPHAPKTSPLKMLLSDFGLSKRLDSVAQSSFSQTMHHPGGTAGWRAPEILRGDVSLEDGSGSQSSSLTVAQASNLANGGSGNAGTPSSRPRLTRAVDIFALGCLSYYLLTSGDHPFGARYEREVNIMRNQCNLTRLEAFGEEGHEASHLISRMIHPEPTGRLRAAQVLNHPYFWDAGKRLGFLQDVSDRLEVVEREKAAGPGPSTTAAAPPPAPTEAESSLLRSLESSSRLVTEGGDWTRKVDKAFMDDLGKWRKYQGSSVRDLLRALRNKKHHYQDMPPALRRSMGAMPEGFLSYFTRRFPKLFLHVYGVVGEDEFVKTETTFRAYFADQETAQ